MKRIMSKYGLIASLLTAWMLTACTVDDAGEFSAAPPEADMTAPYAVYDGEWTIDKEVVDTARLEVTNALKVRLPAIYLSASCFEKEFVSSLKPFHIAYKGQPVVIPFKDQGYSSNATFNSISSVEKSYNGITLFQHASFYVTIDGINHQVDLFSDEPGNAVYRNDNEQWTIGFTISSFRVTNLNTHEKQVRMPKTPITLYYSTKKRIR